MEVDINGLSNIFEKTLQLKSSDEVMEIPTNRTVQTEDTGKMFEMAICKAYNIQYNGKYKYDMALADKLYTRLQTLKQHFPQCTHTAKAGSPFDFTADCDTGLHLSAKTCKKGQAKVAPQVIGQAKPEKLCNILNIVYTSVDDLKCYIQNNISTVLHLMIEHTFKCPNIYYHNQRDSIKFIKMIDYIDWDSYAYTWTRNWNDWKNSTVCKVVLNDKNVAIAEFQVHEKNRKNMAIRFFYDNILELFKSHFEIIDF